MSDFLYTVEMTAEEYAQYNVPAVLLDASLYSSIEFTDDTTIAFSGASALESWIAWEGCELIGAAGAAKLDENGRLAESVYDVTYSYGSSTFTVVTTVTIEEYTAQIEPVEDVAEYISLSDPAIPYLVERAYGYTLQSRSLSGRSTRTVVSAAVQGMLYTTSEIDVYGSGVDSKIRYTENHEMMDLYGSQLWSEAVEERYQDGTYTYTYNEEKQTSPVTSENQAETLRVAFANVVASGIPVLADLASIELVELPEGYLLEFTLTEEMKELTKETAASMVMADPKAIDAEASAYTHQQAEGYMGIDAVTGLPTSVSTTYSGAHTVDGYDYALGLNMTCSIDAASFTSYTAVTEEPMPMEEPEEKATPLFYQVTGPDGEQMWLMGTIHVGDARMAYLPQEIYDAFNSADALAVEYNSNAFDEQMENDDKLAQQVYDNYFYADGTTIADHISDAKLYEDAQKRMKLAGEYYETADLIKAYLWSQTLDNFYLRLGYKLSADYGLDNRLMDLAEEQGKEILDVESGLFQIEMLTGYSDALQEEMLAGSVGSGPSAYYGSVQELYELWCSGDEAALIEYLAPEDTSEMTEEELALYEEYTKAMEWDRNAGMLEVAKEYLSSGKTVFFAVGLAHLIAEDGLVNTLREAGYTVELVTYA